MSLSVRIFTEVVGRNCHEYNQGSIVITECAELETFCDMRLDPCHWHGN